MSTVAKQSFFVLVISVIIAPIMVAAFVGFGSIAVAKSEQVTRVVASMETAQKDFSSIAEDLKELNIKFSEISTTYLNNHIVVLQAVKDIESKNDVFKAETKLKISHLEEKQNHNKNQISYLKGRVKK